jgi:hypothetical protein
VILFPEDSCDLGKALISYNLSFHLRFVSLNENYQMFPLLKKNVQ